MRRQLNFRIVAQLQALNVRHLICIFSVFFFLPAQAKVEEGIFHICYFSLNNEREFQEMDKFTKKLNAYSSHPIRITEYMTSGGDPEKSFIKMVESGEKCDGLVISGHHTGSFGGKRAMGSLGIDFLEKLSCDERYRDWFHHIKALWLQGCRTLGTGEIVSINEEVSADYHTDRVGALLDVDHLEQSLADLNIEFSATLDQDNPLSSRYLRVFPSATVFGWTKTAPGEVSGSEYSIPFHIAHLARLLDEGDRFPAEGPLDQSWTAESALRYREALSLILNGGEYEGSQCNAPALQNQETLKEQSLISNGGVECSRSAWQNHGRVREQSTEYGFWNPDLQSYPALMLTGDEILSQAGFYNCRLRNSTGEELLEVLDKILQDSVFIRYTYNSLLEKLRSLKNKEKSEEEENEEEESEKEKSKEEESEEADMYAQVIDKLQSSVEMSAFLSEKLNDPSLGILRKIDYYAFYEEIYGKQERIRAIILNKSQEIFQNLSGDSYEERDYKRTLLRSLSYHGYFQSERGLDFLKQVVREDPSERVRRDVVRILVSLLEENSGVINVGDIFSLLKGFRDDPSEEVKADLVFGLANLLEESLGAINEEDVFSLLAEEAFSLLKEFKDDPSEEVRKGLVSGLAVLIRRNVSVAIAGESFSLLKGFKDDPSEEVRADLVYGLTALIRGNVSVAVVEESFFLLKGFRDDPSEKVRRALVFGLAVLIRRNVSVAVVEESFFLLKGFRDDPSEKVRKTLVFNLVNLIKGNVSIAIAEESFSLLKEFKDDPSEEMRAGLVSSLTALIRGNVSVAIAEESFFLLKGFKDDPSEEVRADLVYGLTALIRGNVSIAITEESFFLLKGFKDDPSEEVRKVLVSGLAVLIRRNVSVAIAEESFSLLKEFKDDPSEEVREDLVYHLTFLREALSDMPLTQQEREYVSETIESLE